MSPGNRWSAMEPLIQKFANLPQFLDHLIQEHGHYLFIGLANIGVAVIIWILFRRRRPPTSAVQIIILPLGTQPKRDSEPEPPILDDSQHP